MDPFCLPTVFSLLIDEVEIMVSELCSDEIENEESQDHYQPVVQPDSFLRCYEILAVI